MASSSTLSTIIQICHNIWRAILSPAKRQLTCLILPLILLPLPLISQSKEATCGYVVIIMGYFWIGEVVPLAITSLIPVFAFPLLGIETAHRISGVYLSDPNFVFFGSMIMAVAVEASNLHERIALRILLWTGPNPRWLMLGFQLATAILSMWISNTATTAMMVPIVVAVIKELDVCMRRQSDPEAIKTDENATEIVELEHVPKQQLNIYKGLLLSICFSASIGGTATLIGTGSNIVLNGYLEKFYFQVYKSESPVSFASWMLYALPQAIILLAVCWLWLQILFVGFFFRKFDRSHDGLVDRMLKKKYELLGPITYEEKSILTAFGLLILLWLTRQPEIVPGWGNLFKEGYVTDGTAAIMVSLLLFVLPAENPFRLTTRIVPITAMDPIGDGEGNKHDEDSHSKEAIRTIMTWKLMREKFSWSTLLLLGGGYAMAMGVESSGLSTLIGSKLSQLESLPEFIFIGISCILVTFLTEFSSNVATSSIFIPMVASIAKIHHTNPLVYVLPVALSSSFAFMFPSGTPPNAIVFSAKILRVVDMAAGGCVLNVAAFFTTQISIHTYAGWIFDLNYAPPTVNNGTLNK